MAFVPLIQTIGLISTQCYVSCILTNFLESGCNSSTTLFSILRTLSVGVSVCDY